MKYWCLAIVWLLGFHVSLAQDCDFTLSGFVLDEETEEPIPFVSLFIQENNQSTLADEQGFFQLKSLCSGDYTLLLTHVGCEHKIAKVKIEKNLSYNFSLHHHDFELMTATVMGKAKEMANISAVSTVGEKRLAAMRGAFLGDIVADLPGVATLKTGNNIAKPVIQGLHSNRILVMNNGVRQEGQQWGLEHAPEIDPFTATKIKVIKGAAGIRYGSDALGGVLLLEPKRLPTDVGISGAADLIGFSNGRQGVAALSLEGKLSEKIPLQGRIQGTLKKGGNLHTPDYFIDNTGTEEYNFSYALAYQKERMGAEVYYSQFNSNLGIFSGSHIGNLTDLQVAIDRGRPIDDSQFSYAIGLPRQHIEHELFKAKSFIDTGTKSRLHLQYSRQYNLRQEFDSHSRSIDSENPDEDDPENQFRVITNSMEMVWKHHLVHDFHGQIGGQFWTQDNRMAEGNLIPDYTSQNLGVFVIERWRRYGFPFEFEVGLRYDWKSQEVDLSNTEAETMLYFEGFSGMLGGLYRFNDQFEASIHFGSAWRSPNINELYSDGVHHGSASYEKGRDDLLQERAFNGNANLRFTQDRLSVDANLFHNVIENYIYLQPDDKPVLTIRGAFPSFSYQQANARLTGASLKADWDFTQRLNWEVQGSLLRGWNRDEEDFLALMPTDRLGSKLTYNFEKGKKSEDAYLSIGWNHVFEQKRIPDQSDYAPAPGAYDLLDFEAGMTLWMGKQSMTVIFKIENLLNVSYREYLNRFRYFTDEPGRNFSLRLRVPFSFIKPKN